MRENAQATKARQTPVQPSPLASGRIDDRFRQLVATGDAKSIGSLLKDFHGDLKPIFELIHKTRGNAFAQQVLAARAKIASFGEASTSVTKLRDMAENVVGSSDFLGTDGKVEGSGAIATTGTKATHGRVAASTAEATIGDAKGAAKGDVSAGLEGAHLKGSGDATVTVLGTRAAIHSRPRTHTLFGEQLTAQFHVGVEAHALAELQGEAGLDIDWTGYGAKARLTGLGKGAVGLVGAAGLMWTKKSAAEYAARIAKQSAWRTYLAKVFPDGFLHTLPDAKVEGWLTQLVGLLVKGSGDSMILGATTSANARGALGLPALDLAGGSLHCATGTGLSFEDSTLEAHVELGKTHGMELLAVLALGGSKALFDRLRPNVGVATFVKQRIGSSGVQLLGKKLELNGTTRLVDKAHHNAADKHQLAKIKGRDVTYTKANGQRTVKTGEAAREEHASQLAREKALTGPTKGVKGTVRKLAGRTLGSSGQVLWSDNTSHEVAAKKGSTKLGHAGGMEGEASGSLLGAKASAGGSAKISSERLTVGGNARASAELARGEVKIRTPPLELKLFDEDVTGKFAFAVDAGVFAEAEGAVDLDVGWRGGGINASLSGFAGAKAGISGAGTLMWNRRDASYYANRIIGNGRWIRFLRDLLPDWVAHRIPEARVRSILTSVLKFLLGSSGERLVLGVSARGEGSAGIGAAGAFSAGFRGGVVHCHGRGGVTLGLGVGATVDLSLGITDGMALLSVLALEGTEELAHVLKPPMNVERYLTSAFHRLLHSEAPAKAPAPHKPARPLGSLAPKAGSAFASLR